MRQCCLQVRSDQKVEYFPLSASSSTTTSKLLPAADRAETKLRRPKSRPNVNDRIVVVGVVCVYLKRTATCSSYTPEHTCISWSYVVRLLLPCPAKPSHWERGGGERASERASPVGFKRAHQQASISAPKYTSTTSHTTTTPPARPQYHPTNNTYTQPTMAPVTFWAAPRQYINWAARHKPAILWSLVIGSFGPLIVVC